MANLPVLDLISQYRRESSIFYAGGISSSRESDVLGGVFEKAFDLLRTLSTQEIAQRNVHYQLRALENERQNAVGFDAMRHVPIRRLIYGLIESLEKTIGLMVNEEGREGNSTRILRIKQEMNDQSTVRCEESTERQSIGVNRKSLDTATVAAAAADFTQTAATAVVTPSVDAAAAANSAQSRKRKRPSTNGENNRSVLSKYEPIDIFDEDEEVDVEGEGEREIRSGSMEVEVGGALNSLRTPTISTNYLNRKPLSARDSVKNELRGEKIQTPASVSAPHRVIKSISLKKRRNRGSKTRKISGPPAIDFSDIETVNGENGGQNVLRCNKCQPTYCTVSGSAFLGHLFRKHDAAAYNFPMHLQCACGYVSDHGFDANRHISALHHNCELASFTIVRRTEESD